MTGRKPTRGRWAEERPPRRGARRTFALSTLLLCAGAILPILSRNLSLDLMQPRVVRKQILATAFGIAGAYVGGWLLDRLRKDGYRK